MRPAVPLFNIHPFNYRYIGYSPSFMPPLPPSFSQPRRRSPRAIISPTLSAFYHKKTKVNKKSEFGLHEQTDRVELRTMYYTTRSFTVGIAEIGYTDFDPSKLLRSGLLRPCGVPSYQTPSLLKYCKLQEEKVLRNMRNKYEF